jgi:hypothetical protein
MFQPSGPTLKARVLARARRARGRVLLSSQFADLSGRVQVSRALKALVDEGKLVRCGYGLYALVGRRRRGLGAAKTPGLQAMARAALEGLGGRCRRRLWWRGIEVSLSAVQQPAAARSELRVVRNNLRDALEMHEMGVQMFRETLQRRHPRASAVKIEAMLSAWLSRHE